jgi:IclR family pca regulon transcriptional regulator
MDPKPKDRNRVRALEKGLALLSVLSRQDSELSLERISQISGFSKTTCYRLLQTMRRLHFVTQSDETKGYQLGARNISIGMAAMDRHSVRSISVPYMRRIKAQTNETVNLTILDGVEVVFVERIEANFIINSNLYVGSRLPVHCSSMGKAILAYLPEDTLFSILDKLDFQPHTAKTITSRKQFMEELTRIRTRGIAVNNEELEKGLYAIAAPILDRSGASIAAMNISFPLVRHCIREAMADFVPIIKQACMEISNLMGFKDEQGR